MKFVYYVKINSIFLESVDFIFFLNDLIYDLLNFLNSLFISDNWIIFITVSARTMSGWH